MGPDARLLVKRARKIAITVCILIIVVDTKGKHTNRLFKYEDMYGEEISTTQLVTRLAAVMQEYTQSGYGNIWIFMNTVGYEDSTLKCLRCFG